MPANLINTSNQIQANTAGQTRGANDGAGQAPIAPSPGEIVGNIFGPLGDLLAGGSHPEANPIPNLTPLQSGTDSVRGNFGGLVPRRTSVTAPGPAGGANAATAARSGAQANVAGAQGALGRLFNRLRPGP